MGRAKERKIGRVAEAVCFLSFRPFTLPAKFLMLFFLGSIVCSVFAGEEIAIPQPADLGLVAEPLLLEAIETAQKAVRDTPDDAETWGKLGHIYLVHGWEVTAMPCYRRASRLAPDEFRWHYFFGRLAAQREPQKAVDVLRRAIALHPAYAPAHLYLASALRILGRFDEARARLKRAKHLHPENPFSELWLGEIALARQEVKLARTHLQRALRLNPGQSEAHALMAQVTVALGDTQTAKQHAEAARQPSSYTDLADPLWWEVLQAGVTAPLYAERGRRYISEGNFARAVAELEPLISHAQKDVEVWLDYGIALLHTERYSEALAALESTLVLLRSDKEVRKQKKPDEIVYLKAQSYGYIGQIYYETGRADAAIHTCQKAIQLCHSLVGESGVADGMHESRHVTFFANAYSNLAMVYEDTGQLEQAIVQYQKALELLPTKPSLHRELAGVYWKKRRYAEAEPHYKVVIADNATDVRAVYRLGLILLMKEQYMEAVSQFKRVIALDSAHVRAYGALGLAYQKLGNFSEAAVAFEMVLRLEPGNQNALKKLKQLHEGK